MEIVQEKVIDILDQQGPALSSTTDMPVVETKPDSVPEPKAAQPKEEAKAETEAVAEQLDESATSTTEEDSGQPAGEEKPRGVGKRLAELTKARKEAEEREAAANERLNQALAALERVTGKPVDAQQAEEQAGDPEPVRPTRTEFPDQEAYDIALDAYVDQKAAWVAKREVKAATEEARKEAEMRVIEEQQRVVREAYDARIAKVTERYPDFKEVANTPDVQVSMPVAHAIIHHEMGPEIQYYLGKNPEEAARIMTLSPPLQLMEVGFIVHQLKSQSAAPAAQPAQKPPVSAAPKPIKPIAASAESVGKDPESMSMEEYAAKRKAEWAKSARH